MSAVSIRPTRPGDAADLARLVSDRGRTSLWLGVLSSNSAARRFYTRLGARDEDARIQELDGAALRALADKGKQDSA